MCVASSGRRIWILLDFPYCNSPICIIFLNVEMCDKTHEESHGLFYSSGSFTYYWNNCVEDKIVEWRKKDDFHLLFIAKKSDNRPWVTVTNITQYWLLCVVCMVVWCGEFSPVQNTLHGKGRQHHYPNPPYVFCVRDINRKYTSFSYFPTLYTLLIKIGNVSLYLYTILLLLLWE